MQQFQLQNVTKNIGQQILFPSLLNINDEKWCNLNNIEMPIYIVFKCFDESDGYLCFEMKGCFSTVDKAKEYIAAFNRIDTRSTGEPCHPDMCLENDWTLVCSREFLTSSLEFAPYQCKGFCIETVEIDPPLPSLEKTQSTEVETLKRQVELLKQEIVNLKGRVSN